MGSYLSGFNYETSQDPDTEPVGSNNLQDYSTLPWKPMKLDRNTSEISPGIHQNGFETQDSLSLDTEKQLGSDNTNYLPCLDEYQSLKTSYSKKNSRKCFESVPKNGGKKKLTSGYKKGLHSDECTTTESIVVCSDDVQIDIDLQQTSTESREDTSSNLSSSCAWEIDMGGFFVKKKRRKQTKSGKAKENVKENKNMKKDASSITSSYTDAVSVVTMETMALRKVFDQRRW